MQKMEQNPSRRIKIEKVTLNIGAGAPGPKLEKAKALLIMLTDSKPCETKTKKRIPGWGLRPGLPIGCKVTLRRKRAEEMLAKLLQAVDNKLSPRQFDNFGNLAFGIKEYLEIPDIAYNPDIGIMGLEAAVTFCRQGYRIKKRKIKHARIPKCHLITKEEAINFIKEKYGAKVGE